MCETITSPKLDGPEQLKRFLNNLCFALVIF